MKRLSDDKKFLLVTGIGFALMFILAFWLGSGHGVKQKIQPKEVDTDSLLLAKDSLFSNHSEIKR